MLPRTDLPRTTAERSGYRATTRHEELLRFLEAVLASAAPRAAALRIQELGTSHEGRRLPLVVAAAPPLPEGEDPRAALREDPRLRIFVNANIHPGEVEGKEAVLQLIREIAAGQRDAWLQHAVLLFVPNFNADGNERIHVRNRVAQNGPTEGVGVRPNAQGLDLNRDFVKVESPEVRALLAAWRRHDPHLFFDLHTTNGSHHGYHLTYSPALAVNVDEDLDRWARDALLATVRERLATAAGERPAFRLFDYGNFLGLPERGWATYDHRARYGTNGFGLRHRVAVLSEAYSYVDFRTRIAATHAFVCATIDRAIEERARLRELCAAADAAWQTGPRRFGYDSTLGPAEEREVLLGEIERIEVPGIGVRLAVTGKTEALRIPVQDHFVARAWLDVPEAWVLVDPAPAVLDRLEAHGVERVRLPKETPAVAVEEFVLTALQRRPREFQGHRLVQITGNARAARRTLPAGSVLVLSGQRLGRVAAQLLDPVSEDSLTTWNFFDEQLPAPEAAAGAVHPVLRLRSLEGLEF